MSSQTPKNEIGIALVQMSCEDDPARNLSSAAERIAEAARAVAQIVCLPELFRTQYFCQVEDVRSFELAEPIPGPTTELLSPLAAKHQLVIIASVFERRAAGIFHNTALVIDAD